MRRRWRDSHLLVGADGSVYSEMSHRCIGWKQKGYMRVVTSESRSHRVHRLVMELYGSPCPDPSYVIDHINGEKTDNRVENLQWLSQRDNVRKGRNVRGMTLEKAREMRELYRGGGVTIEDVASQFSVPYGSACTIVYGHRWAD